MEQRIVYTAVIALATGVSACVKETPPPQVPTVIDIPVIESQCPEEIASPCVPRDRERRITDIAESLYAKMTFYHYAPMIRQEFGVPVIKYDPLYGKIELRHQYKLYLLYLSPSPGGQNAKDDWETLGFSINLNLAANEFSIHLVDTLPVGSVDEAELCDKSSEECRSVPLIGVIEDIYDIIVRIAEQGPEKKDPELERRLVDACNDVTWRF
ncbi:hypothetical protein HY772_02175 [Candidatus Woesearchaeota archaeon]|nr:hypothetical protein [Candidatus Woesearchaeota archaeon]